MGCGVVGSGVADILLEQSGKLGKKFDREVALKKILDIRDFAGTPYEPFAVKDCEIIFNDPEISAVVVTIGGLDFAYNMCKRSLECGKHVITSNKEVVAAYGRELTQIAFDRGIRFLYEASAGGGIPVIRPLNICLAANDITEIKGILNGTTNYILTRMEEAGISFEEALKEAQGKGYAEANPTADVDGFDAARKIAILSSIAYGAWIDYNDVCCRGIRDITSRDIKFAKAFGGRIKLIAGSELADNGVKVSVEPTLVKDTNMLCSVGSVYNAVLTRGSYTDYTLFYGQGAGKLATASAVLGDIIEILGGGDKVATLPGFVKESAKIITSTEKAESRYLRYDSINDFELFDLASCEISADGDSVAILTEPLSESAFESFVSELNKKLGSDGPALVLKAL